MMTGRLPLWLLTATAGVALLTLGCGDPRASHQDERPVLPLVLSPEEPASYDLADPGCEASAPTLRAVNDVTIHEWDGQGVKEQQVTLAGARSEDSLATPAISGTTYHDVYERTCDLNRPAGHECDNDQGAEKGWTHNSGQSKGPLRICRDGTTYGRLTYEGIALTSAYFVQQAHDKYVSLAVTGGAKTPDRIHLSVIPYFIDYDDNYMVNGAPKRLAKFVTHNLAYFPGEEMIAVFPERADLQASEAGYFWESQFILGHEYGHHIDFMRHGRLLNSIGLRWDPVAHDYVDDAALAQGEDAASDRAHVAGALAEGFADMMGYYADGGSNRSITGVPGMGDDRDVGSDHFRGGTAKVLTEEHLATLLGRGATTRQDGDPDYTDIHIVGAIIAHACDKAFTDLTAAGPTGPGGPGDDVAARYRLALSFSDALVAGVATLPPTASGDDVLAPIGAALQKAADQYLSGLGLAADRTAQVQQAVCADARTILPALKTLPYAKQGSCSPGG